MAVDCALGSLLMVFLFCAGSEKKKAMFDPIS
jgi:hypothetical protein